MLIGLAVGLFGFAGLVLVALLIRQPIDAARQRRIQREKDAIYKHILDTGFTGRTPTGLFRSFSPVAVALVTNDILEFAKGDSAVRAVQRAREIGLARGALSLSRSRHASDRVIGARLLRHSQRAVGCLMRMAQADRDMQVRAAAITSLAALGQRIAPKRWSTWMELGRPHPHSSVSDLLGDPALISTRALQTAVLSAAAPDAVRCWSVAVLAGRDPVLGDQVIAELIGHQPPAPAVIARSLDFFSDPLRLSVFGPVLAASDDWQVRAALAGAVQRTYAVTLMPQVAQLATDPDWRVRRCALAAMRRLGGFDTVAVPAAIRPQLDQAHADRFAGMDLSALLDERPEPKAAGAPR